MGFSGAPYFQAYSGGGGQGTYRRIDHGRHQQNERPSFSRFEIGLLIAVGLCAGPLVIFTIIYIIQHRGSTPPAAIAALSCTSFLLLVVGFIVYRRLRKPNNDARLVDVEAGAGVGVERLRHISAPMGMNKMQERTFESKGTYTVVPGAPEPQPVKCNLGLADKVSSVSKGVLSGGGGFWASRKSPMTSTVSLEEQEEFLFPSGSERSSTEMSDGRFSTENNNNQVDQQTTRSGDGGLWSSVFELASEARHSLLLRAAPPSKQAQQETDTKTVAAAATNTTAKAFESPRIVVTKPEPAVSPPPSRGRQQQQQSFSVPVTTNTTSNATVTRQLTVARQRGTSLAIDPLRSHPVQFLGRESSTIRQTKSAHNLPSLSRESSRSGSSASDIPTDMPRRPRSAEPGPDRTRLGFDLPKTSSPALSLDCMGITPLRQPVKLPVRKEGTSKSHSSTFTPAAPVGAGTPQTNALRRLKNHHHPPDTTGPEGQHDLRAAYQSGA